MALDDRTQGALAAHDAIDSFGLDQMRSMAIHGIRGGFDPMMRRRLGDDFADAYWFVFNFQERG